MERILKFVVNHWELVSSLLILIVTGVIQLFKKKPVTVVDSLKAVIMKIIPLAISATEINCVKKGSEKLDHCLDIVYGAVKDEITLSEFNKNYKKFVVDQIEMVLATPQKKEVSSETKNVIEESE